VRRAMKSLVHRVTNEDWKTFVRGLMKAEGIEDPSDEEVRRFDRKRKKKTGTCCRHRDLPVADPPRCWQGSPDPLHRRCASAS
jgi:hypothetical protein